MVGRVVALCLVAGGCFAKPDAPAARQDGALGVDATQTTRDAPDSDAPPTCPLRDDFSGTGSACGTWGTTASTNGANAERVNDELVMRSDDGFGTVQCQSIDAVPFDRGVVVRIRDYATAQFSVTGMRVELDDASTAELRIVGTGPSDLGMLEVESSSQGTTMIGTATVEYYWIRPHANMADTIEIAWGPDGTTFPSSTVVSALGPFDTARVVLFATLPPDESSAFDDVDACPP